MTIYNLLLKADEAVAMSDTKAINHDGSQVTLHKVDALPGAILTGSGNNTVFGKFARLVYERGYTDFDGIAADIAELAHDALAERLEELRKPGSPEVPELVRQFRNLMDQGDPEGLCGGVNYQMIVAGPSKRLGRMAGVMTDFHSGKVQELEVPSFSGNDPDVCPPAAASGVPTIERQAAVLRAQYHSSVRWARETGFKGCEPELVGGGDVEATIIRMDGEVTRHTLGPLVEQARSAKVGRNEPCPCGSGQKYKRCCLRTPTAA
ncbi:YecA family protein [Sediminicurvatus halobius]|nr:SEC-C metal-binding domain-containing protein [Spiribacter halobius]UEX78629.1 SEC-C domain-containing protein [Spiribacter halobius]